MIIELLGFKVQIAVRRVAVRRFRYYVIVSRLTAQTLGYCTTDGLVDARRENLNAAFLPVSRRAFQRQGAQKTGGALNHATE